MKTLAEFLAKLKGTRADDFHEEIEAHIEAIAERHIERGMSRAGALTAARREFGNPTRTAELARESWTFQPLDELKQDLRMALRGMRRAPALSAVIIATLALGIGATTAIFSVVHGVLIEPLPYPSADRLVWLGESTQKATGISVTWLNYQAWAQQNHTFDALAAFAARDKVVTGGREPEMLRVAAVTTGFQSLLGMRAQAGRLLVEADDAAGAAPVVVLSDAVWRHQFGANRGVLNSTLQIDGHACQIVGVAEPLWQFFPKDAELFVALGPANAAVGKRSEHGSMRVLGRLHEGVTVAQARADINQIMERLETADPGPEKGHLAFARLLSEQVTRGISESLWALLAAVGLLLLIACGNVAGLLVSRNLARQSEIAIRMAIGAGRGRLVRAGLTESMVFALIGGTLGVFLAHWCTSLLSSIGSLGLPRLASVSVQGKVLLFAIAAAALTGLLAGVAPVWSVGRGMNLAEAMQGITRSATSSGRSLTMRAFLVTAQVAVTLVLVFGSVALLRSLAAAQNRDPGFEPSRLLALELLLPGGQYRTNQSQVEFYDQLQAGIAGLAGVESAAVVLGPPALGARMDYFYSIKSQPEPKKGEVPVSVLNAAGPGYFATAGIRMVAGREFAESDRKGTPCVAVVNQALGAAVGDVVKIGGPYMDGDLCEIVGLAANVGQEGLDSRAWPEIYLPVAQSPRDAMAILIRTRSTGDFDSVSRAVRSEVARLGPGVPIQSLRPVTEALWSTLDRRRFGTWLLAAFAGLALMFAAIGIYGLLDFWVGMRRREIALRLVLGATRASILKLTGWQVGRLVLIGSFIGVIGAYLSSRWLESLVYGTAASDAQTLGLAAGAMVVLGVIASAIPIWRAVRVSAAEHLTQC